MLISSILLALCSAAYTAASPTLAQEPEKEFSFWLGGPILKKRLTEGSCEDRLLDIPYYVEASKANHEKRYSCHGAVIHTVVASGRTL
ncbi:hypothetical protein FSARC_10437 [Fusarium sarcochroum]|uniref:Uncharacterized protein n=1 Tax=Fusarium sarcochroum TaxID=1208366 RepID=A0A8H4X4E0_9HYPO|nr:hypothetical protein FSARC_10437 [Fusarium sarcochroum]